MTSAKAEKKPLSPCLAVAVTGAVAAAHTPGWIWYLRTTLAGEVHVLMTRCARHFVTARILRLASGNPVYRSLFQEEGPFRVPHIELSERARLLLVLPATANILAKAAHGIADDLVSTAILTFGERVVFVPAMNQIMWENAIVQENVEKLVGLGRKVIAPTPGIEIANGRPEACGVPRIEILADYLRELLTEEPAVAPAATVERNAR
jgi:phosphopantothenoylcysteine decarboxylase/phosphopantothenate--cysteine ligase